MTDLRIFTLSVGQADCSVIVTPDDNVVVIDAVRPDKLNDLLGKVGVAPGGTISLLIITHPHYDHCSGGNGLLNSYDVKNVALAPFWYDGGFGPATYRKLVNRIEDLNVPVNFVSGYNRYYPDGALDAPGNVPGNAPIHNKNVPYVELVGPSNGILDQLTRADDLNINHLSVMARITWQRFRMVLAADAQMENWAHYDHEGMLNESCQVLKTAHHGSANGTQWERIDRLAPRCVIVSSDPAGQHHLPDVIGASVFARYERHNITSTGTKRIVALTRSTGTIEIRAKATGGFKAYRYGDTPTDRVNLQNSMALKWNQNPTNWQAVLQDRVQHLYSSP